MGCASSALSQEVIDVHGWEICEKLGQGAFAEVHMVRCRKTGQIAAAKALDARSSAQNSCHDELCIWWQIGRHGHVISLIDTFRDKDQFFMVMEKCDGTIMDIISDVPKISIAVSASVIQQMLEAIRHLHSLEIVHRDIKPDNFLRCGEKVKLCDFGLAAKIPSSGELFGTYGTLAFMSPEMIGTGPHNTKTDIWSLGVVCHLVLYGCLPFLPVADGNHEILQSISDISIGPRCNSPRAAPISVQRFVESLLERDMCTRVSAPEALEFLAKAMPPDMVPSDMVKVLSARSFGPMSSESLSFTSFTSQSTRAESVEETIRSDAELTDLAHFSIEASESQTLIDL